MLLTVIFFIFQRKGHQLKSRRSICLGVSMEGRQSHILLPAFSVAAMACDCLGTSIKMCGGIHQLVPLILRKTIFETGTNHYLLWQNSTALPEA